MSEEIPEISPPLTAEEQSAADKLIDSDLQVIDAAILAETSDRWLKVARVAGKTANTLSNRYPNLTPSFYAQRLRRLVKVGCLESQGNLDYMRFSEIRMRLPN